MIWIGIDPGKDGALAWINDEGYEDIVPFNDAAYVAICYQLKGQARCALEKVGARPGQSPKSMFSFGENYGFIKGILEAFSIPYQEVHPLKWKKEYSISSDKSTSIKTAKRLFPGVDLRKNDRCKKDHDGCAEALLIAEWARRHMR